MKKHNYFKGLPKERVAFILGATLAKRAKPYNNEPWFMDKFREGLKSEEMKLDFNDEGSLALIHEPRPKPPSYDELKARVDELEAKLNGAA